MKILRQAILILVVVMVMVSALVAIGGTWFVWQLHPWLPAGRALALGNWRFGDLEFQVWQRKNPDTFEPFADFLFVRSGTNRWQAFCFDIQDGYSPKVRLRKEHGEVLISRSGENRGAYDLATQTFRRNGLTFPAEDFAGNPPGDWW